jgi:hypothetical protein
MNIQNPENTTHMLGHFPLSADRLHVLRLTLARDLALLQNVNLASVDPRNLMHIIKSAATAKALQFALSKEAIPQLSTVAALKGGSLSWTDAVSAVLEQRPDMAVVNLDLGTPTKTHDQTRRPTLFFCASNNPPNVFM